LSDILTPDFEKPNPSGRIADFAGFGDQSRAASYTAVGHYTGSVVDLSRFLAPGGAQPSCFFKVTGIVIPKTSRGLMG
jgi:hypothetical protein